MEQQSCKGRRFPAQRLNHDRIREPIHSYVSARLPGQAAGRPLPRRQFWQPWLCLIQPQCSDEPCLEAKETEEIWGLWLAQWPSVEVGRMKLHHHHSHSLPFRQDLRRGASTSCSLIITSHMNSSQLNLPPASSTMQDPYFPLHPPYPKHTGNLQRYVHSYMIGRAGDRTGGQLAVYLAGQESWA